MPLRPTLRPAVVALVALGLARPARGSNANAELVGGPRRPMPIVRPEQAAPPERAQLVYFGGRVVSNVQAVMVLWGAGTYAPYVTGEVSPSLPAFFAAVAGGSYVQGLSQYDTTRTAAGGGAGTNQRIGPGDFGGLFRIAPSGARDEATVDDASIMAELAAQLAMRTLPAPRPDAGGNPETLYLVYFPAGKRISLGGDVSCQSFCAYHGSFRSEGRTVYYAVMPDLSPGSGCDLGCGHGAPFANAAVVAAHELAEVITDPEVGAAPGAGPPLAWYDPVNGEIGDLCNGQAGMVPGTDGASWPVQKLWSNADGGCVVPSMPAASPPLVAAAAAPSTPSTTTPIATAPLAAALPEGAAARGPRLAGAMTLVRPPEPARGDADSRLASAIAAVPEVEARPRRLAGEPSPLPLARGSRFTIEEENDALGVRAHPTDEFYTQGLRVSSRWALSQRRSDGYEEVGFAFGQNIYTPSNIRTADLATLRQDRPYAGWLYAALLFRAVEEFGPFSLRLGADAAGSAESALELEIAGGVTGPDSRGGAVQSAFHSLVRNLSGNPATPPAPAGWAVYQTANRPTLDTSVRYEFDALQASAALGGATARTGSMLSARISPRARLDVGTMFDAASLGLEVRMGLIASRRVRGRPSLPFELYAFGRVDRRYVAYNGFIEGPLRNGVTTLVAREPWVSDLDIGAVLRLGGLELGYGQLLRTSKLRQTPPGARRIHEVGQATVALVFP